MQCLQGATFDLKKIRIHFALDMGIFRISTEFATQFFLDHFLKRTIKAKEIQ